MARSSRRRARLGDRMKRGGGVKALSVISVSLVVLVGVSLFLWLSLEREIQLPSTALSNDVSADSFLIRFDVTDAEGISRGQIAVVDREAFEIRAVSLNTLFVTRAVEGTSAASHRAGDVPPP